jgi:hypothetical protein
MGLKGLVLGPRCIGPERDRTQIPFIHTLSLTSALDGVGGQRHAPATLLPGERPGTHFIRSWMSPRAGLESCGKSRPYRDSIFGPSSQYWVAIPTTLSRPKVTCYISQNVRWNFSWRRMDTKCATCWWQPNSKAFISVTHRNHCNSKPQTPRWFFFVICFGDFS